jgi:hypothetical protein
MARHEPVDPFDVGPELWAPGQQVHALAASEVEVELIGDEGRRRPAGDQRYQREIPLMHGKGAEHEDGLALEQARDEDDDVAILLEQFGEHGRHHAGTDA